MKNVSCMSRAGWSFGTFSASKLYHSLSTSGPSARVKPMSKNIRLDSRISDEIGRICPFPDSCMILHSTSSEKPVEVPYHTTFCYNPPHYARNRNKRRHYLYSAFYLALF